MPASDALAQLTVHGPGRMRPGQLRRIAAWLRQQAEVMETEAAWALDRDKVAPEDRCPVGSGCGCSDQLTEGRYRATLRR